MHDCTWHACVAVLEVPVRLERKTGSRLSPEAVRGHVIRARDRRSRRCDDSLILIGGQEWSTVRAKTKSRDLYTVSVSAEIRSTSIASHRFAVSANLELSAIVQSTRFSVTANIA